MIPLEASVDVVATARKLIAGGALTEVGRVEMLRTEYESSLARSLYPSLQAFIEAVDQQVHVQLNVINSGATPESLRLPTITPAKTLRRDSRRNLDALFEEAVHAGVALLAAEVAYDGWLAKELLPEVGWTRREIQWAWAYWSWRKATKAKGKAVIRINRALMAPKTQISDELLSYLIWHELCHHLTPGQGHNAEFRRLEAMWPDSVQLNHQLDTLSETYDLSKKDTRSPGK